MLRFYKKAKVSKSMILAFTRIYKCSLKAIDDFLHPTLDPFAEIEVTDMLTFQTLHNKARKDANHLKNAIKRY